MHVFCHALAVSEFDGEKWTEKVKNSSKSDKMARHALEGSEVPDVGILFFHHKPKLCSPDEHDGHDADDDDVQHSRSH